eukprot:11981091-Heterocapsa_arctica.AAC.1
MWRGLNGPGFFRPPRHDRCQDERRGRLQDQLHDGNPHGPNCESQVVAMPIVCLIPSSPNGASSSQSS